MFVKKGPLEYQKVIKKFFITYLQDSSDSCDSSDTSESSDSSDSSNSSDSSDSNGSTDGSDQITLYTKKFNIPKTYLPMWR